MARRPAHPRPTSRLRFDALEPRETPATPALDFAAGFTADRLTGGVPAGYAAGDLLLTDGRDQARAVFAPARVDVRAFRTSFVFRIDGPAGPKGDGFTFALTGNDRHAAGTAGGGTGEGLGYQGLMDSVAVKFDLVNNAGEGANSVGVFTGGAAPTTPAVSLDGTGIDLHSGHPFRADLHYVGPALTLTLTDLADPSRTWTRDFAVDIPAAVGADTAYAGFTGGTGLLFARQAIESWTYTEGRPEAPFDQPPVITAPVRASWLSPGSVALRVEAMDDGGAGNLRYFWAVVSAPPGAAPGIDPQPDGSAHVTLDRPGRHWFRVTVRDARGLDATAEVGYSDPLRVADFEVGPRQATVRAGESVQFQTLVRDPSGSPTVENLGATWRVVSGPGTIDAFGRYTAPIDAAGPVTVQAEIPVQIDSTVGTRTAEATVVVQGEFEGVDLTRNGSARVTDGRLRLADGPHQAGSAYSSTPMDVRRFSTSFWFRVGDQPSPRFGDGLTFVLQNAGPAAIGSGGSGLGYEGIGQSVAVKFDLVDNVGEGAHSVGVYTNGAAPTVPADRLPGPPPGQGSGGILLDRGQVFRADLTYADGVLKLRLTDTVTGHAFGREYTVDIPAAVGGPTALAGFTAGTGELFAAIDVLKWTFPPAEPPPDDWPPSLTIDVSVGEGVITTVAGTGTSGGGGGNGFPAIGTQLGAAYAVAVDVAGNLFFADRPNSTVRRVDAGSGLITTVAGNGGFGFAGDGGSAERATLGGPAGVAVDAAGNLFIADFGNHRVRRVDADTGVITTVAGTGTAGFGGDDGPATSAALSQPSSVSVDAAGNLYIADTLNNRVRRVDAATGTIRTVAGTGTAGFGGDGGPAAEAPLFAPGGVAVDAAGNLYIADTHNQRIRRVEADTGVITTVAGTGTFGYAGDDGPATSAQLNLPAGLAVDAAGNVYIADTHNQRVRRVDVDTGLITTVAGTGTQGYGGDGGPAAGAALNSPAGVAMDAAGNLFIADTFNDRVRRVGSAAGLEGSPATYTFTIRNTSPASTDPVTVTSVRDDRLGDLSAIARAAFGGPIVLDPGHSLTFRHTTGPRNPTRGPGTGAGRVTATGHDDEGTPVFAGAVHDRPVADVAPAVRVDKVGPGSVAQGQTVTYTYTITNTSPADTDPVAVTSIADDRLGELLSTARAANGGSHIILRPGGAFTFSASGPAGGPGTVVTTVTVTANDDEGTKATASDTETVTVT